MSSAWIRAQDRKRSLVAAASTASLYMLAFLCVWVVGLIVPSTLPSTPGPVIVNLEGTEGPLGDTPLGLPDAPERPEGAPPGAAPLPAAGNETPSSVAVAQAPPSARPTATVAPKRTETKQSAKAVAPAPAAAAPSVAKAPAAQATAPVAPAAQAPAAQASTAQAPAAQAPASAPPAAAKNAIPEESSPISEKAAPPPQSVASSQGASSPAAPVPVAESAPQAAAPAQTGAQGQVGGEAQAATPAVATAPAKPVKQEPLQDEAAIRAAEEAAAAAWAAENAAPSKTKTFGSKGGGNSSASSGTGSGTTPGVAGGTGTVTFRGSEMGNALTTTFGGSKDQVGRNLYVQIYQYMPLPSKVPDAIYRNIVTKDTFRHYYQQSGSDWTLKAQAPLALRDDFWNMLETAGYDASTADYKTGKKLSPVVLEFAVGPVTKNKVELVDLRLVSSSGSSEIDEAVIYGFRQATFYNKTGFAVSGRFVYGF